MNEQQARWAIRPNESVIQVEGLQTNHPNSLSQKGSEK